MRPHLDYCEVIYDKPHNEKFTDTVEPFQYNLALAITGAIKGTSKEKLYNEHALEYLKDRQWIDCASSITFTTKNHQNTFII